MFGVGHSVATTLAAQFHTCGGGGGHSVATTLAALFHTCGGEICCRYNIDCSVSHMWGGTCCRYDIDCSVSHMLRVGHSVATTLTAQFHTCWCRTCCRYDIDCSDSHMWGRDMLSL